ncbi:unnamed protein product [Musa textilis]
MMMASRFHRLVLPCLLTVAMLTCTGSVEARRAHVLLASAAAPAAQRKPQTSAEDQFLTGHNQARAAVGVGRLRWSPKLGSEASRVVAHQKEEGCGFADLASSPYGANQLWTSYPVRPAEAVRSWVEEGKYYSYANNSCAAGHECGTYTQVVWRNTAEVGCAQANCVWGGATLTLCLYNPPGNIQGQTPY